MRLSGPILEETHDPADWIEAVQRAGYEAASVPLPPNVDDATAAPYLKAAAQANIVIGEVGAWSNPIDPDPAKARAAIAKCQAHLDWAERIGACCCVNIAGSRSPTLWDGPHRENFRRETFDLIVQTTREIIDAVKPKRTFFTLETMPWIFPSSPRVACRSMDWPRFTRRNERRKSTAACWPNRSRLQPRCSTGVCEGCHARMNG